MANNHLDTSLFDKAVIFAVKAHQGTERRGKGFPYIIHPMEAAEIASTITDDQEILAAAILHDTVEDTPATIQMIREDFGERVASLVESESDVQIKGKTNEESWHARKQDSLKRLEAAPLDAKIVALSDKLSNMRAIARD
ncbi:MAG: bifunctional (p)ppGpp synthetase/guanosine-3',5'-bis(diphosphate) 3'-pyrophosphohydrolase, partial [Bacteroidales bacterium]|nr:bifunctional (p)ppGpp synthetase/guanosine-3',5'-bis(diphosphate) 3'-pyrophosphohydrolase [Bacteroidales bacterium]